MIIRLKFLDCLNQRNLGLPSIAWINVKHNFHTITKLPSAET